MAVLAAIKSFPARPRHLGLGHVHDLLGLLYIGSSTFRGETIEIKPQDHIDVNTIVAVRLLVSVFEL